MMPSSRPGIKFNSSGVCTACEWHEKKKTIDWSGRSDEFKKIANWAKETTAGAWDCVLGVSGGKDSLWQAHQLRDKFYLNPLLVMYVSSDVTELGRENAENLVKCGFDVLAIQPNPRVARLLAKKSFLEFGNIAKFSELALFSAPFRTAIENHIPLVLFGENPALEAGDTNIDNPGGDASGVKFSNTLSGAANDIWMCEGIENNDLTLYTFPTEEELRSWGGRGVFMGYFLNWSGWENAIFSIAHGLTPHSAHYEDLGVHYKHHSIDSDFGAAVNFMLKHVKFGFGETTEQASYDVRAARITREEGAALVRRYDGKCSEEFILNFCNWIGITSDKFWDTVERFRGDMSVQTDKNDWALKNPIWDEFTKLENLDVDKIVQKLDTVSKGRKFAEEIRRDKNEVL